MDVTCISDLHGHYPKLDGGDLLIVAGDLTRTDTEQQYFEVFDWLEEQRYKKKILIAGNHDMRMEAENYQGPRGVVKDAFTYLCDSGTEFEGLKIWGSPWTQWFPGVNPRCNAFMVSESKLEAKWAKIPHDIDILITHSPPFAILDQDYMGINCGDIALKERIDQISLKLHVFGHIHAGHGQVKFSGTMFVNAAHMNDNYEPVNKPIRVVL